MKTMDVRVESYLSDAVDTKSVDRVANAFSEYPECVDAKLGVPFKNSTWLCYAAKYGNLEIVKFFFDHGNDVNAADADGRSPLSRACDANDEQMVKWLLEHGADPCINNEPMIAAVFAGNVNIVKMFVERGADYNFTFADDERTPLSLALMYGRSEVAEYLQSLGVALPAAKDAAKPGAGDASLDEAATEEIVKWIEYHSGGERESLVFTEMIPGDVGVSIWTVKTADSVVIFTCGMSSKPMPVPSEYAELAYAELVMRLPKDWPVNPNPESTEGWPYRWLRTVAHYPHERQTWLGAVVGTFKNGNPPRPLDDSTDFAGFLLIYNREFPPFEADSGKTINSISAMPVYREELQLAEEENGFVELFQRFDEHGIGPSLAPGRTNVAATID